jgi:hypothetical protein
MKVFKKGEKTSIEWRFKERKRLMKPFIVNYKKPVIVHAIHDLKVFEKILIEEKLKLPEQHNSPKKCPLMEKFLGIDNSIYYSLGFVYSTAYDFKYNLIFDLNYLRDLIYYSESIIYRCYKAVIDYLDEHDYDYLQKLANTNKNTKRVIDKYYNKKYKGKTKMHFDFWEIEKETFDAIMNYPNKKELIKMIDERSKKFILKYPKSVESAKKDYLTEKIPEIIGRKENNLLRNPHFLGFYIKGKIPKKIAEIIKEKYPNKIIFDGRKIKGIRK